MCNVVDLDYPAAKPKMDWHILTDGKYLSSFVGYPKADGSLHLDVYSTADISQGLRICTESKAQAMVDLLQPIKGGTWQVVGIRSKS